MGDAHDQAVATPAEKPITFAVISDGRVVTASSFSEEDAEAIARITNDLYERMGLDAVALAVPRSVRRQK